MKSAKRAAHKRWSSNVPRKAVRRERRIGRKNTHPRQSETRSARDAVLHNWLLEEDAGF